MKSEEKEKYEYFINIFNDIKSAKSSKELEDKLSSNLEKIINDGLTPREGMVMMNFLLYGSLMAALNIDIDGTIVDETIKILCKIEG